MEMTIDAYRFIYICTPTFILRYARIYIFIDTYAPTHIYVFGGSSIGIHI